MKKNELIADKFEEVIMRMFVACKSLIPKASEYTILYDPRKHNSWFIVIFFADSDQLREGLKNGVCYRLYSYLLHELNKADEISGIDRAIYFESGNRPTEKIAIDNLLEKLIKKLEAQTKDAGKADIKVCGSCGHNFDNHQLLCNLTEDKSAPTEGWMMCPEENCNCFGTWSANYNGEI